jgi:N-acetylated-alpha-linked acidic dipeptidase
MTGGFTLEKRSGTVPSSIAERQKSTGLKPEDYFATIPSLPLSYDTAHEILKVLAGPGVPAGWQGGLPRPYHVGPGPGEVRLSVAMDYSLRTIWNVIATLPGAVEPDRWVIVGNHRDAWVYGAVDPGSGTAATLEMCRALGSAVKNGWKPRRSIVYASWDAEEYGLVGSTEWAEEHASEIDQKGVLLLNVDSAVSGRELEMSGVPSLRDLMLDAAGAITDPRSDKSLRATWTEARRTAWAASAPLVLTDPVWDGAAQQPRASPLTKTTAESNFVPQMGFLGSGSDYTVFLDHLGIPAADAGFKGSYGVYHSVYDDFHWMEKFGDPEFLSHTITARLYTLFVMRAAAADVVPLKFVPYGLALRQHVDQIRLLHAQKQRKGDPAQAMPELERLARLVDAVKEFQARAGELDRLTDDLADCDEPRPEDLAALNEALVRVERAFLLERGLAGRPWFKHSIYAPGLTTGYACWPLPAIRQDIEENNQSRIGPDIAQTAQRIKQATAALETAGARARDALKAH